MDFSPRAGISPPSILDRRPGLVRIEALHLLELLQGARPEVLLIDPAAVTDDERLDAAAAVFRGSRYQGKASDHHAFDDEVHGTVRGGGSLALQNLEVIAVVGLALGRVPLLDGVGYPLADRAAQRAIRVSPGQSVVFARSADDVLCELVHLVALALLERVVVLGFHIAPADLDGVQLITADAPSQQLLATGCGVERPLTAVFRHRDRSRPILFPHDQDRVIRVLGVYAYVLVRACLRSKLRRPLAVLHGVAARDQIFLPGPEDLRERRDVKLVGCCDEGVSGLLGGVESLCPGARTSGGSRRGGRSRRWRGGLLRDAESRDRDQGQQ